MYQIDEIDIDIDTFGSWVDRVNEIIQLVNTQIVTVNTTLGVTIGNGYVEGSFGANVISAQSLRGGDANTSANLVITSNVNFNSPVSIGANVNVNTSTISVGANVVLGYTGWSVGNATVNVYTNSSVLTVGNNLVLSSGLVYVGNSTVNSVANSTSLTISNSTVTFSYIPPSAAQKASGGFFLNSNGSWTNTGIAPGGANTNIQFADSGVFGGSAAFTFIKTTNTLILDTTSTFMIGNSTVNSVANSTTLKLANSTSSIIIRAPSPTEAVDSYFLSGNGTWIQVSFSNPITGSNTYVQINDEGTFGSSSGFTFNQDTNTLSVGNTLVLGIITETSISTTTTGTSGQVIDSFAIASFRAAKYIVSVKDTTANGYQTSEILLVQDDGNAYITEYAVVQSNGALGVYTADINTGNARLILTPTPTATAVKIAKTLIPV